MRHGCGSWTFTASPNNLTGYAGATPTNRFRPGRFRRVRFRWPTAARTVITLVDPGESAVPTSMASRACLSCACCAYVRAQESCTAVPTAAATGAATGHTRIASVKAAASTRSTLRSSGLRANTHQTRHRGTPNVNVSSRLLRTGVPDGYADIRSRTASCPRVRPSTRGDGHRKPLPHHRAAIAAPASSAASLSWSRPVRARRCGTVDARHTDGNAGVDPPTTISGRCVTSTAAGHAPGLR
jgi:hypothetical protein